MLLQGTTPDGVEYMTDTFTGRTTYNLLVGDRVRWSTPFLRSTYQVAGPEAPTSWGPWAEGTLCRVRDGSNLVRVRWDDGTVAGAHIRNLAPAGFYPSWEV